MSLIYLNGIDTIYDTEQMIEITMKNIWNSNDERYLMKK